MHIVVAPDSFKGSLSAPEVAAAVAAGLRRALPRARVDAFPMADGGEGTAEVLCTVTGGHMVPRRVVDPLGNEIEASFAILGDGATAVVELAAASGLPLVPPTRRDPMFTTTFGTGQLIMAALEQGCRRIMVTIGGSATVDGGLGMLSALGFRFLDGDGLPVPWGGRGLKMVRRALRPAGFPGVEFTVACDVDNPLVGPQGAAAVFGPQKGATPAQVVELDEGLAHLATIWKEQWGADVALMPGAGAAGGAGAAMVAGLGAALRPGAELVLELSGLRDIIPQAHLVVTGEGKFDFQTLRGKAPAAVARLARRAGVPVAMVCGEVAGTMADLDQEAIAVALSICEGPMTLEESMSRARELLERAGERLGRLLRLGKQLPVDP